jgi:hypothetical protein
MVFLKLSGTNDIEDMNIQTSLKQNSTHIKSSNSFFFLVACCNSSSYSCF